MTLVKNATSGRKRRYFNLYHSTPILLGLVALAGTLILTACGSAPQSAPSAMPTAEPPASIATAVAEAEATVKAALAKSGTDYCGRLCQSGFWISADVAALESELARGSNINAADRDGFTPLHYAALLADISVVMALLDRGVDIGGVDIDRVSDRGLTPLHVAATGGSAILSRGHDTVLRHQDPSVIALLLERGVDVNTQNKWGTTPLHEVRDPVVAALPLSYGADIEATNIDGGTPLQYAASYANSDVITLLLANGADVNTPNEHGTTPLHRAVTLGTNLNVIKILLKHGANVNARSDNGKTACKYAMELKRMELERSEEIRKLVCP